jgi:polysaccharide transporter, PST family
MTLIKTSIFSGISTIIKIMTGFISIKLVAVYIGPSGLALMGQMQNFISMMRSVAGAGINNGVIKYTAEHYTDDMVKQKIWSSALKISMALIVPIAIAIIFLADFISMKLLNTTEYGSIFIVFAVTVVFFVLNGLLTSILNGQKEIRKLTILNIIGSIFGLGVTIVLVIQYELYGALIAGIISQTVVFFVTLFFVIKSSWFKLSMFLESMDIEYRNKLLKYSAMVIVSATMTPLSHMYIRDYIGTNIGWDEAGYWQAIWRISETYLMLITATLGIYYLPKLSSIHDKAEIKRELIYGYKIIIPTVIIIAFAIYIFRDHIIQILFTDKFSPMAELFLYQLIGDVVKIAAWLLSYIMVAKAMIKIAVISEVLFIWSFAGFVVLFVNMYGLIGVTIAFLVNYCAYLIFIYFFFRGYLNEK